jgi:hypothetical protein
VMLFQQAAAEPVGGRAAVHEPRLFLSILND